MPMSDKQPIGFAVDGWTPRPFPPRTSMTGRLCRVEPLDIERHATQLHEANLDDADGRNWTYLHSEPSGDLPAYRGWLEKMTAANDPFFHAIIDNRTGEAVGVAAYLRIDPANGVIEVGHINYSPRLQRTAAATEAMALMMRRVFDELGYRRYEWKCDSLNAPSRVELITATRLYGGKDDEKAQVEKIWKESYPGLENAPIAISADTMLPYGASATPTFALVDRQGLVRLYSPTRLSEAELSSRIEEVLSEAP